MVTAVHELEKVVKQSFPDANIKINDLTGNNDHYHLKIKFLMTFQIPKL